MDRVEPTSLYVHAVEQAENLPPSGLRRRRVAALPGGEMARFNVLASGDAVRRRGAIFPAASWLQP